MPGVSYPKKGEIFKDAKGIWAFYVFMPFTLALAGKKSESLLFIVDYCHFHPNIEINGVLNLVSPVVHSLLAEKGEQSPTLPFSEKNSEFFAAQTVKRLLLCLFQNSKVLFTVPRHGNTIAKEWPQICQGMATETNLRPRIKI